jgi:Protein of unknown function (DUF4238)
MTISNDHHFVPAWYQRAFLPDGKGVFFVLDKEPVTRVRCPDGALRKVTNVRDVFKCGSDKLFQVRGLYSVQAAGVQVDAMERSVFGHLDNIGARASAMLRSWPESGGFGFRGHDQIPSHYGHPSERMQDLLLFLNAQRERTPRGIAQMKQFLAKQGRIGPPNNLIMMYFQRRRQLNCTVWAEGMWEIFSAKKSQTKFLLSDDPVTLYNCDCYPASQACTFPNDPHPFWRGTRVLYPLSPTALLAITHNEHADDPKRSKAQENRRNARSHDQAILNYTDIINERELSDEQVHQVNFVLRARATRYVASSSRADLYPERAIGVPRWSDIDRIFYTRFESFRTQSTLMVSYQDGGLMHSNAFGERDHVPGWFVRQQEAKKKSKE